MSLWGPQTELAAKLRVSNHDFPLAVIHALAAFKAEAAAVNAHLGVLTLTAATAKKAVWKVDVPGVGEQYDVWFGGTQLMWDSYGPLPLAVGIVAAAVSAAIAVKWLVSYLQSHGLSVFGWYRIALGVIIGGLLAAGVFTA